MDCDRSVLLLQRGVLGFWKKRTELPATVVAGASLNPHMFFGNVQIHLENGASIRMQYETQPEALAFVGALNQLVARPAQGSL